MFNYIITIAILATPALCFSGGAPKTVCTDLTPRHGPHTTQTSTPPYTLDIDTKAVVGKPLNFILKGNTDNDNIKGFIIQARLNDKPVGKFVHGTSSQVLECTAKDDTLTHQKLTDNNKQINAKWIASADLKGKTVQFVTTIVKRDDTFWVKKLSKNVKIE